MADEVAWEAISVYHPKEKTEYVVHRDAAVPDFVDDWTRSVLRSVGAIRFKADRPEPEEDVAFVAPDPAGPADLPKPPVFDGPDDGQPPSMPGRGASKEAWVEYAKSRGMDEAVAESFSRDELRDYDFDSLDLPQGGDGSEGQ